MFAQTRQIHHEGVFKLAVNVLLDILKVNVFTAVFKLGPENIFPVRTPFNFLHTLASD